MMTVLSVERSEQVDEVDQILTSKILMTNIQHIYNL